MLFNSTGLAEEAVPSVGIEGNGDDRSPVAALMFDGGTKLLREGTNEPTP
jgi:hypothetical protein